MSRTINLGRVTAYADAVAAGYTGTREEFSQDLANAATYAAESHASAETASAAAETASTAATTATAAATSASDDATTAHADAEAALSFKESAETAAGTATTKAGEASNSASQAATSASGAAGSATAASGSATAAAGSATNAAASETAAAASASAAAQTLTDVNSAGATQIAAIQAKGDEVLASIPPDYIALSNDLKNNMAVINGSGGLTPLYKPLVIGSTGKWTSATSYHICIPVNAGDTVALVGNTIAAYYGILTSDRAVQTEAASFSAATGFTARILLDANASASFTVPADGKYLYCNTIDTQGRTQIPVSIKINGVEQTYNVRKKIDAIAPEITSAEARALAKAQWVSNIIASQASTKTIHFSCDDVTFLSALLADPAPTSIWDVPELGALKSIHDASGACITLMLFNELDTYDISNIPSTWAAEFQAAKSWLRFAMHAKTSGTNYATDTTAAVDYAKFVSAVYAFTGDYGCIDRVPRLGYYGGTLDQLKAMQALDYGPVGFLTADDVRLSYYLDDAQNAFVNAHGRYFDAENAFIFVPTIARLDTGTTAQTGIDAIIARGAKADMYIEIFCHASGTSSGMITRMQRFQGVAEWATQHGYVNGFLTDYFA